LQQNGTAPSPKKDAHFNSYPPKKAKKAKKNNYRNSRMKDL